MTPQTVSLFSGPPKNPEDELAPRARIHGDAGAARRQRRHQLRNPLARAQAPAARQHRLPPTRTSRPTATIDGIDLVTEGVLTLKRVIELVEEYRTRPAVPEMTAELDSEHGAAKLAKMLIEQCTDLKLFIGKASQHGAPERGLPHRAARQVPPARRPRRVDGKARDAASKRDITKHGIKQAQTAAASAASRNGGCFS